MNVPKFLRLIFVAALCTFIITGGSNNVAEATEGFNAESTASKNLLENVTLELVNPAGRRFRYPRHFQDGGRNNRRH